MAKVFVGLMHYPIYNKRMEIIATSITNLDLHDIARSAVTYGAEKYFIIHPDASQQKIVQEIIDYWQNGYGGQYNSDRSTAFEVIMLQESLDKVCKYIKSNYDGKLITVATDARIYPNSVDYRVLRTQIASSEDNYLILFGTGWGISDKVITNLDYRLLPIMGCSEYNHLSVRSAAAIILDRLLGENW